MSEKTRRKKKALERTAIGLPPIAESQIYIDAPLFGPHTRNFAPLIGEIDDHSEICGTAIIISPGLAITATHVMEEYVEWTGQDLSKIYGDRKIKDLKLSIFLPLGNGTTQDFGEFLTPDSRIVYNINKLTPIKDSDITLISLHPDEHLNGFFNQFPVIDFRPPAIGDVVRAFGYPDSSIEKVIYEEKPNFNLGLDPKFAEGAVIRVFPERRAEFNPAYPAFDAELQTKGGMSGGPVIHKRSGKLIGMVTASFDKKDKSGLYTSTLSSLAPLITAKISGPLGENIPFSEYLTLEDPKLCPHNLGDYSFDEGTERLVYNGSPREF